MAVLGHQTAEDLFGDDDPIGRAIKINPSTGSGQSRVHFRAIGVMEEEGGGMGFSPDEVVFIPLTTAYQKLFGGRATSGTSWEVSSIAVTLASEDYMDAAVDDITWLLRQQHKLKPGAGYWKGEGQSLLALGDTDTDTDPARVVG